MIFFNLVLLTLVGFILQQALLCPVPCKSNSSDLKPLNENSSNESANCLGDPQTGRRSCSNDNGGCSQLCVNGGGNDDYHCRCNRGYRLLQDGHKCKKCHTDLYRSSGEVSSYGYPEKYDGKINCTWTIHPLRDNFLYIQFVNLDVRSTNCCSADYIEIIAPRPTTSGFLSILPHSPPLPKRICGFYNRLSFYWMGEFNLNFRSDADSSHTGFRIYYQNKPKSSPELSLQKLLNVTVDGGILDRVGGCSK